MECRRHDASVMGEFRAEGAKKPYFNLYVLHTYMSWCGATTGLSHLYVQDI